MIGMINMIYPWLVDMNVPWDEVIDTFNSSWQRQDFTLLLILIMKIIIAEKVTPLVFRWVPIPENDLTRRLVNDGLLQVAKTLLLFVKRRLISV